MNYKEIYNIHAYFSGPSQTMLKAANISGEDAAVVDVSIREAGLHASRGDAALRKIAREGKLWKNTVARKVDMEGQLLQLFLRL